jgi:hypothetical protein
MHEKILGFQFLFILRFYPAKTTCSLGGATTGEGYFHDDHTHISDEGHIYGNHLEVGNPYNDYAHSRDDRGQQL